MVGPALRKKRIPPVPASMAIRKPGPGYNPHNFRRGRRKHETARLCIGFPEPLLKAFNEATAELGITQTAGLVLGALVFLRDTVRVRKLADGDTDKAVHLLTQWWKEEMDWIDAVRHERDG